MTDIFEEQLCDIINEYESNTQLENFLELSDLQVRCFTAIERIAGRHSVYFERVKEIEKFGGALKYKVPGQIGVAKALLADIKNGYLKSLEETIHSNLFADYLEMAAHLADKGYKDPAAVLAGSTLETHLRNLCGKHKITVVSKGGKPKKVDTLNADIEKAGVYNKSYQKSVTAWLDIRNKAAHGKYDEYSGEQVKILIDSVREFINRHPA